MARSYRFFSRNPETNKLLLNGVKSFFLSEVQEPEIVFQLLKVLRVRPDDTIILLPQIDSATVSESVFKIVDLQKKGMQLELLELRPNDHELNFELELVLSLPNKPDKLELILQKAVEIGAAKITLVEADFSQMKHALRFERLGKIVVEAAEQSERARIPQVAMGGKLREYLQKNGTEKSLVVGMERASEDSRTTAEIFRERLRAGSGHLAILIGPEGGFSHEEKLLMADEKLAMFSLGKLVLRMETAAIVSLGLAAAIL